MRNSSTSFVFGLRRGGVHPQPDTTAMAPGRRSMSVGDKHLRNVVNSCYRAWPYARLRQPPRPMGLRSKASTRNRDRGRGGDDHARPSPGLCCSGRPSDWQHCPTNREERAQSRRLGAWPSTTSTARARPTSSAGWPPSWARRALRARRRGDPRRPGRRGDARDRRPRPALERGRPAGLAGRGGVRRGGGVVRARPGRGAGGPAGADRPHDPRPSDVRKRPL